MKVKLQKVGNSLEVILPPEAIDHLQATVGRTIYLTKSSDSSVHLSADPHFARTMAVAEKLIHRYRNALRELADS